MAEPDDDLGIPDFLRIPQDIRNASWLDYKPAKVAAEALERKRWDLPKTMSPEAWALLRSIEEGKLRKNT